MTIFTYISSISKVLFIFMNTGLTSMKNWIYYISNFYLICFHFIQRIIHSQILHAYQLLCSKSFSTSQKSNSVSLVTLENMKLILLGLSIFMNNADSYCRVCIGWFVSTDLVDNDTFFKISGSNSFCQNKKDDLNYQAQLL